MEEYKTLIEVIKFILFNIPGAKTIVEFFTLKNLYLQIGGTIGTIGIILTIIVKIKDYIKKHDR